MRYEVEITEYGRGIAYLNFEGYEPDEDEIMDEAMQAYEDGNVVWGHSDAMIANIVKKGKD